MEWEIGNIASSEIKTVNILLQDKKGEKKEYPVVLKGVLKSTDKVIAEAAPVTLISSEPKSGPHTVTPISTPTVAPSHFSAKPTATPQDEDDSVEGDASNAQPTPAPRH